MKEINNILIGVEDTDKVEFNVDFENKRDIDYIEYRGIKYYNTELPVGVL